MVAGIPVEPVYIVTPWGSLHPHELVVTLAEVKAAASLR